MIKNRYIFGIVVVLCTILCSGCTTGSDIEGTYGVEERPDLVLKLFDDQTFYYKGNWYEFSGDYSVEGDTIYFKTSMGAFTGLIEGNTITDSEDGIVWVKKVD